MKAEFLKSDTSKGSAFLKHRSCQIVDNRYGYYTEFKGAKEEVFIPCGSAVIVDKVLIDLESCERFLKLKSYDSRGKGTQITMSRNEMTDKNIVSLVKFGVQVEHRSAEILIKCLENQEISAPVEFQHRKTGFDLFEGKEIFKGHNVVGLPSEYVGEIRIKPKGSFKSWLNMVKTEVLGTPMEVVLASALSSAMIDFVYKDYPTDNLLMSLVGDSTTGKTTALTLAVSAGALPSATESSLMLTFLDTELSIIHRMASAYPVGIDEASVLQRGVTKLLYALANGKERGRMRKDLSMAETAEFHTSIFMSSERSILSMADENAGLRVRVMEFSNVNWTTSAESADNIKRSCMVNYGWAIPKLANHILELEKEEVIAFCEECTEDYLSQKKEGSDNALVMRMAKKVGIVLATAQIAEDAFGIEFDLEMIKSFFLEYLMADPDEYDIGIKAYDTVIDYITQKPEEFAIDLSGLRCSEDIYRKNGYVTDNSSVELYDGSTSLQTLYIKKETFEKILENNKFRDSKVVLRRLKELGLLISDRDRYISTFKLGQEDVVVKGYKLRLRSADEESEEGLNKYKRRKVKQKG